jgi:decaprenylphospho-beta-D-ribofuranose 2-oxidase
MKSKSIILPSTLLILLILTKFLIWEDSNRRWIIEDIYKKPASNYKATVAPAISIIQNNLGFANYAIINDASKLNSTEAVHLVSVQNKQDIHDAITKSKKDNKPISLSGARHSMGGQNLGQGIHLEMLGYDKVLEYSEIDQSVTVQSGIMWKQLQQYLGPNSRAVRVMQDSNIFTVGGSMGSNVHGKDIRFGQLIESINWFKIIDANNVESKIDRSSNLELFRSVIGGFGGFGVITEVNLKTNPNSNYKYTITHQPVQQLIQKFDEYIDLGAEQIEGHFSVSKDSLLQDLQIYYFQPTEKKLVDDVSGENSIWLRKLVYRLSRDSDFGKKFRWFMQKHVSPIVDPGNTTRNGSMAAPFRVLELDDPVSTDILQEYFIPRAKVNQFVTDYRQMLIKHNMNLVNCGLRRVQPDTEALVGYSPQEMYGFVCYYNVSKDNTKNQSLKDFTGEMLDYLNLNQGKFYLAYNTEGFSNKIIQMYPELKELLLLKQKYDPQNMFQNKFFTQIQN